jgi:hypothetical protein
MITHKGSRLSGAAARLKRVWSELGEANRRMFDVRTGERFMSVREKAESRGPESRGRVARRTSVRANQPHQQDATGVTR